MASVNKAIIVGNLGRDPEIRYAGESGAAIANIVVATSRRYKDSQGEVQEETEWHRVVVFGKTAEAANQYLRKGSSVYVEGYLRTHKYTDKEGIERYVTEIIGQTVQFLSSPKNASDSQGQAAEASAQAPRQARPRQGASAAQASRSPSALSRHGYASASGQASSLTDEEIPF